MNAIRKIVEVKNHQIKIDLPENFYAELVEVIIFPKIEEDLSYDISEDEKNLMRQRLANSKDEDFEFWDDIKHKYQ